MAQDDAIVSAVARGGRAPAGLGPSEKGSSVNLTVPPPNISYRLAFASAVASESRTKWPKEWWSAWLIPVGVYGGATVVGVSRMYHNAHWASDVALGAAIGTFSGVKVIQYAHNHPNNRLDRFMLGTSVVPTAHALTLMWSTPTR